MLDAAHSQLQNGSKAVLGSGKALVPHDQPDHGISGCPRHTSVVHSAGNLPGQVVSKVNGFLKVETSLWEIAGVLKGACEQALPADWLFFDPNQGEQGVLSQEHVAPEALLRAVDNRFCTQG